jgi:hypothetical protein
MYSGEYDACDVTPSVYPHCASLKNMPGHGGNRTYVRVTSQASYTYMFKNYILTNLNALLIAF